MFWILTQSIGDARFGQIVRGHLEADAVADGEADEMPPHFAGNVGEDFVLVVQHYAKHRARQNRLNGPFQFNWLFTAHTVLLWTIPTSGSENLPAISPAWDVAVNRIGQKRGLYELPVQEIIVRVRIFFPVRGSSFR
jgi:hypothetical protein